MVFFPMSLKRFLGNNFSCSCAQRTLNSTDLVRCLPVSVLMFVS